MKTKFIPRPTLQLFEMFAVGKMFKSLEEMDRKQQKKTPKH